MAGDGISLPTSIAQMGSVAKTQAKTQHVTQQAAPFADQLEKKDELRTQRVRETQKADQQGINPDAEREKDKRRRRRLKRGRKFPPGEGEEDEQELQADEGEGEEGEKVGLLIDLRV